MKNLSYLLVLSGLVSVPATAADAPASPHTLTGNIGLTTDYVFRGVSQTQNGPAIQGGVDYSHASGIYAGFWASNVSWVSKQIPGGLKDNNSLETDFYAGYKGSAGDVGYDLGLIRYFYPGDTIAGVATPDTTEVYVGASWKFLSLKYSHVVSKYFIGWTGAANASTRGSNYLDLSASHDLGDGWGLIAHVGHQKVEKDSFNDASYTDWKIGVSKDVGFGTVTLAYTDTNATKAVYTWNGDKVADGRIALSFSKSF